MERTSETSRCVLKRVLYAAGLSALLMSAASCAVIGDVSVDADDGAGTPSGGADELPDETDPGWGDPTPDPDGNDSGSDTAQTLVLGVDDAYVNSALPTLNFNSPILEIDGDPDIKYALVKPRGIERVPAGSRIARATLDVLTFNGGNGFGVHVLTAPWRDDEVTFARAPGRTDAIATAPGTVGLQSIDLTEVVQSWVDGETAHGVALFPRGTNGVDIYSSEDPDASLRPRFVIDVASAGDGAPDDGGDDSPDDPAGIAHVGTTEVWDRDGQGLTIARPEGSAEGDLLVLVLHRTDDDLPLYVDGWTRVAECYKRDNGFDCSTEADCTDYSADGAFCDYFGDVGRGGHDLAQSVFVRPVGSDEPAAYRFDLNIDTSGAPGWAILTALRGAALDDPIRDWAATGCDRNEDSVFPSVTGEAGDMVLLSQSFDDAIARANFGPPAGTTSIGYVSNSDEAGFLFAGVLADSGATGPQQTIGQGGPSCKDALVSFTIRPR